MNHSASFDVGTDVQESCNFSSICGEDAASRASNCVTNSSDCSVDLAFSDLAVLVVPNPQDFKYPWISNQHFYPNILTYLATLIFGLVGNTAFIVVMMGDRKSRTTTNMFLVSLTVADLLMLAVCAPLEIVRLFVVLLNFGGAACRMGHYFMMLSFTASVLNLTAVSLERFIVIVYPMRARSLCTMNNCRRSVLLVWFASLLLACPIIWVMGEESIIYTNPEKTEEVVAHYCRDVDTLVFPTYRLLVLFFIPGILMIAFYTSVIRELWLSTKNINVLTSSYRSTSEQLCLVKSESYHMKASASRLSVDRMSVDDLQTHHHPPMSLSGHHTTSGAPQNEASTSHGFQLRVNRSRAATLQYSPNRPQQRSNVRFRVPSATGYRTHREKNEDVKKTRKQVIKMLIVVVLLFLLCWGPTIVTDMLIGLGKQTFTQEFYMFKWVSSLLPFVHCCINPIIYCFMSKNFRASMIKTLSKRCCCCCCHEKRSTNWRANSPGALMMASTNSQTLQSHRHTSLSTDMPTLHTEFDVSRI